MFADNPTFARAAAAQRRRSPLARQGTWNGDSSTPPKNADPASISTYLRKLDAMIGPPNSLRDVASSSQANSKLSLLLPKRQEIGAHGPISHKHLVRDSNHLRSVSRDSLHTLTMDKRHQKGDPKYHIGGSTHACGIRCGPKPAIVDIPPESQTSTIKSTSQHLDLTTELSHDDFVVLVMGETGAGKSTFIERLSGRTDVGVSHGLASGTKEVRAFATKESIAGKRLVLVDTPGAGSADLSDADILVMLAEWLLDSYQQNVIPKGVLLLRRIDTSPLCITYRSQLMLFRQIYGDEFLRNVVLVTTMWGEGKITASEKWENALQTDMHFWKPMMLRGAQTARFNNTRQSARDVVDLLAAVQPMVLLLQKGLAVEGRRVERTSAGEQVWPPAEEETVQRYAGYDSPSKPESIMSKTEDESVMVHERQAGAALFHTLENLLVQQQSALTNLAEARKKETDSRHIKELEQELLDLDKTIKATVEQMRSLKVPLQKRLGQTMKSLLGRFLN